MERYRKNPMRVFDSKEHGEALKRELPAISAHLATEDAEHFARVKDLLASAGVGFTEDPYLVRGLDYYTRTVFEVYHGGYGAQSALCGGGRYDDLVEECGGPATPAIGFSAGLERIVSTLPAGVGGAPGKAPGIRYYVVCDAEGAEARALAVGSLLRARGAAEVDLSERSRKKQLQVAEKKGARFAVIVNAGVVALIVRDLVSHCDAEVSEAALPQWLVDNEEKEGDA
jgi:histidyl-tRNA synthetase